VHGGHGEGGVSVKRILVLICGCLLSTNAFAQRPAYEARPGLIPIGGFVLFYDSGGPLSYQTMTPQEVPKDVVLVGEVVGNSCQHGLSIPIISSASSRTSISGAKGDGSYQKALLDIQKKHPDLAGLYDVKVDIQRLSILTIYSKECTIVAAQGFKEKYSNKTTEELAE
jgi:hypothetical protein